MAASAYTLVAIALERYNAICRPLHSRHWKTKSHAVKMIVAVWVISLLCSSPSLFMYNLVEINPGKYEDGMTPTMNSKMAYFQDNSTAEMTRKSKKSFPECRRFKEPTCSFRSGGAISGFYILFLFLVLFIVPLVLMIVLYAAVTYTLWMGIKLDSTSNGETSKCLFLVHFKRRRRLICFKSQRINDPFYASLLTSFRRNKLIRKE